MGMPLPPSTMPVPPSTMPLPPAVINQSPDIEAIPPTILTCGASIEATCDLEVYTNYFLATLMLFDADSHLPLHFVEVEIYNGRHFLNGQPSDHNQGRAAIAKVLGFCRTYTFNGGNYDNPMIGAYFAGFSTQSMKRLSNDIIENRLMPWHLERKYGFQMPTYNHVDLIELAVGVGSLKMYGAKLRCKLLQELPIDHRAWLCEPQRVAIRQYCRNDNLVTMALAKDCKNGVQLRERIGLKYNINVMCKSDPQMGELVLATMSERLNNRKLTKPNMKKVARSFNYTPPSFIAFESQVLQDVLEMVKATPFELSAKHKVTLPRDVGKIITLGEGDLKRQYKMGIGGLHSVTSGSTYRSNANLEVKEVDVSSYYPNIILICGFFVGAIGPEVFHTIYKSLVDMKNDGTVRKNDINAILNDESTVTSESILALAAELEIVISDIAAAKLLINGVYGKFGSHFSKVFAPDMMIHTTLTGQLGMFMLLEQFHKHGINVISANTDGINIAVRKDQVAFADELVKWWCGVTQWVMDYNHYTSIHYRDVNNYFYTKTDSDGKVSAKGIGIFAGDSIKISPNYSVCRNAIFAFAEKGTPLIDTIYDCDDPFDFLSLAKVTGGAMKDGQVLGSVIRWYKSNVTRTAIHRMVPNAQGTYGQVPDSMHAQPLMDVGDEVPEDIDYHWYVSNAIQMMAQTGMFNGDPAIRNQAIGAPMEAEKFCEHYGIDKAMIKKYKIQITD